MKEDLLITNERIDDFVVLLSLMQQMDLPGILDRHVPRHWLQQGLSWGWTASIWLAHIISQGDHRKVTVRDWVRQAHSTLEQVTGLDIRETDFTDDRLTMVVRHLSDAARWQAIEQELGQHLVRVYALEDQPVSGDATTVSGYREGGEDSLWQFGHSKDDPTLRQIKAMMATLDPLGLPLALEVVSGEQADDPLYIPLSDRVLTWLGRHSWLFVGDSKMSALATRGHLEAQGQYYLPPLALVGETAEQMPDWIRAGVARGDALTQVPSDEEKQVLAQGYEVSRTCVCEGLTWQERVLVVRSHASAQRQRRHLEEGLAKAQTALLALTPPVGRGKRQITEEATLQSAAEAVLAKHRVVGLLTSTAARQSEQTVTFVGRGRGGAKRQQQVSELEQKSPMEIVCSDLFAVPLADRTRVRGCFALWKRTRHILALACDYCMPAVLVVTTIKMVPFEVPGAIFPAEQGKQSGAAQTRKLLLEKGFQRSMSRAGTPTENGSAERLVGLFQLAVAERHPSRTLGDFLQAAQLWVNFYTTTRPHESLGYRSPDQYAKAQQLGSVPTITLF